VGSQVRATSSLTCPYSMATVLFERGTPGLGLVVGSGRRGVVVTELGVEDKFVVVDGFHWQARRCRLVGERLESPLRRQAGWRGWPVAGVPMVCAIGQTLPGEVTTQSFLAQPWCRPVGVEESRCRERKTIPGPLIS
jgi:hypothetical protein